MKLEDVVSNPVVEKNGIHFLRDHKQFAYNDGDRAENYVFTVVRQAADVSSDSRELETHIRDWPSLYHLARERSLAYQSLSINRDTRILEVGCGCGSVTRLLGERSDHVVALEGSARRAAITRERTRDLNTVKIICASFEEVMFQQKFDLVVCNGVLEYASLFVKHDEPHRKMIELLAALVAPEGSLVVAIENKLGLRYFSSSKEEHTDVMYDGLEGYSRRPRGPRTFGAIELRKLLSTSFPSVEMLIPLPDYKLPTALIREELLQRADCAELFGNTERHDMGSQVQAKMHDRLVWREVGSSGQLADFANSFFMIAGFAPTRLLLPNWLGDIYSIRRRPEFCVHSQITLDENGKVQVAKAHRAATTASDTGPCEHRMGTDSWVDGMSIHTQVVRALMNEKPLSIEERLRDPVMKWWRAVDQGDGSAGTVEGSALDLNWQNAIVSSSGVIFIDREWVWRQPITKAWLFYRVAAKFLEDESAYMHRWDKTARKLSPFRLACAIAKITGTEAGASEFLQAARCEAEFQGYVTGRHFARARRYINLFEPQLLRYRRKRWSNSAAKIFDAVARRLRLT